MTPRRPLRVEGVRARLPRCGRAGGLRAAALVGAALAATGGAAQGAVPVRELTFCADPSNLPFSNQRGEGFENRIAELLAGELHAQARYAYAVQRRGFLRRGLQAGTCDVVMGVPEGLPGVLETRPYYRSTYVFVSPKDRSPAGLDDPRLAAMKIGLQAVGAEGANTPPAASLAARGLVANVVGFAMWAEEGIESAPARLIEAVATGEVGTAIVWGPIGGYFAGRQAGGLEVSALSTDPKLPCNVFAYSLAAGVRKGEEALRDEIQAALDRRQDDVQAILKGFGVPLLPEAPVRAPNPPSVVNPLPGGSSCAQP